MAHRSVLLISALVLAFAASPALAADTASAALKDKDGKEVGQVALTRTHWVPSCEGDGVQRSSPVLASTVMPEGPDTSP